MALMLPLILGILACTLFFKRSFHRRSIVLLSVLALLFGESLLLIVFGLTKIHLLKSSLAGIKQLLPFHFTLNLVLATVGVLAAVGAAVYVEFGRSRLPLAQLFPEVQFAEAPVQLVERVDQLAAEAGVSPPGVSLIDSGIPSAFITRSRKGFEIAVSVGLIESLDREEVDACIAHELAHLKNKDFVLRFFATMAKVGLFARPLSYIIEPAVYRAREHLADFTAVKLIGGPAALISALSKIHESQIESLASISIATACLFGSVRKNRITNLFNKQPKLQDRISVLQEL
jgi:heat shock protein HtpX